MHIAIILRCYATFCLLVMLASGVSAQKVSSSDEDCGFEEAKKWYREGELEEVEKIESCILDRKSPLSREKRIEALQLLTESYLFRNKISKADKVFKEILVADPLHQVDSSNRHNSWDLIFLSRTYSRRPIFSMYFGGGVNFSKVEMLQNYGVDNTSEVSPAESYLREFVLGGNGCIGFELPLIYNFDLALEANFAYRNYAFSDSLFMSVNPTNPSDGQGTAIPSSDIGKPLLYSILLFNENQFWIDLPLILKYNVTFKKMLPYIYAGGGPNFLIHANLSGIERDTKVEATGGGQIVQPPIKPIVMSNPKHKNSMRTMINWSVIAGAGVKFRLGRNFLFLDLRYTRMFLNNVVLENRYNNPQLLYRYAHVDNDFRTDNFMLTVGFVKAFYVPRKKHEFNPATLDNQFNKWLEKERKNLKKETDEELKSELNSSIKQLEREKPSLIEDVQRGRVGSEILKKKKADFDKLKNK